MKDTSTRALPLDVLVHNFEGQIVQNIRRSLFLSKTFPGSYVRFRRAAQSGPNQEFYLLFVLKPDARAPVVKAIRASELDAGANTILPEEVFAEMIRRHDRLFDTDL